MASYVSAPLSLYGREAELLHARAALAEASAGKGTLLLFTGEPGIGKTRLAEAVAGRAAHAGFDVAWGRSWEAGGAPAYWPWTQLFRELEFGADTLGTLTTDLDISSEARFVAFDRIKEKLRTRASEKPLALVLDDLHAADVSSLLLLMLLARELRRSRILVLGAYRDAEVESAPEVGALLAKLSRDARVFALSRLRAEDVTSWMRDATSRPVNDEAGVLFRITEGHPLFTAELLRAESNSAEWGHPPRGLRPILDERLGRLAAEVRGALEVAAVVGREFSLRTVATALDRPGDAILRAAKEGERASIVRLDAGGSSARFTHMLLRDRLYFELAPSKRARLHWKVGEVLGSESSDVRAVAHHFLAGHAAGNVEHAAKVALVASRKSLDELAFEDAAELGRRGAALLSNGVNAAVEGELHLVVGEALARLGRTTEARAACAAAAATARRLVAPELLARAALAYGIDFTSGERDAPMVALLREALASMGEEDSPLRARLTARLAAALMPPSDEAAVPEILSFLRDAPAMARRLGDGEILLSVLPFVAATASHIVSDEERCALLDEAVVLARRNGRNLSLFNVFSSYVPSLLGRGRRRDAEHALGEYDELLGKLAQSHEQWRVLLLRALLALHGGQFEAAHDFNAEAGARAAQLGSGAGMRLWAGQRVALAMLTETPETVLAEAPRLLAVHETTNALPAAAWLLAVCGRREEAARRLRENSINPLFFPAVFVASETCRALGDVEMAASFYPMLERYRERMFWGNAWIIGPASRTAGDLAFLLGREDEARVHYTELSALARRLDMPWLQDVSIHRLRASDQSGGRIEAGASPSDVRRGGGPSHAFVMRRQGDVWSFESPGRPSFSVRHSKGFAYLRALIDCPGAEIHVLSLVGAEFPAGDAGPVLDAEAKLAYQRRLVDLREEVDEAERFSDPTRAERARAELEMLADQLAAAVGIGGRDRRAACDVERARINVQRRIKDALETVSRHDSELGRYLRATVTTGTFCAFRPL